MDGKPYSVPHCAPLPEFRCQPTHPFLHIGVDFAGPVMVKANITARSQGQIKAYICLFVCATSRAIHLEMTTDLTTKSFIQAFKRFIGRRGVPRYIHSDNGKTFESASKEIASQIKGIANELPDNNFFNQYKIQWNFIVPRAPWWGGFYERMVQMVKKSMRKVIGTANLNYLELETVLVQIEGIINDRPLMYIEEDSSSGRAISPSDLLLGRRTTDEVNEKMEPTEVFTIKRLQYQKALFERFWSIFMKEYLLKLREFSSMKPQGNIAVGDVVHVRDDGPRLYWRLGRIEELVEGRDNVVRAAKVKVPTHGDHATTLWRPLQHLYPLEVTQLPDNSALQQSLKMEENKQTLAKCRSRRGSLINCVNLCLVLIGVIVFQSCFAHASQLNNTTLCSSLNCFHENHGQLLHYDIYERPAWIELKVWICSREVTQCQFYENMLGSTSKECKTHYETLSRSACLLIGATKNSVDGPLKQTAVGMYSTSNKIQESYAWFRTVVDTKKNTMLFIDYVQTDGKVIETGHPTFATCRYENGECKLVNKTMAWQTPCFYNMRFLASEICHHKAKQVYCSESDFDEIADINVCNISFISTKQGSYLSINNSNAIHQVKAHRLNAAVIQHLMDELESLRRQLQCLSQNSRCERLNESVSLEHHSISRFTTLRQKAMLPDEDLNELIKEKIREMQGASNDKGFLYSESNVSWLSSWLSKTEHALITLGIIIFICVIAIYLAPFILRRVFNLLAKCFRGKQQNTEPAISLPMETLPVSQAHQLHRYRTYSFNNARTQRRQAESEF